MATPPDLATLTPVPLASMTASMSSVYGNYPQHSASQVIDGSITTTCFSTLETNAWLSVQVPINTRIGYVAAFNRRGDGYAYLLGTFEIWLGSSAGDTSTSAHRCGEASYSAAHEPSPYILNCDGISDKPFVTLLQTGGAGGYIAVA